MTLDELKTKIKSHNDKIDDIWPDMVKDINKYLAKNKHIKNPTEIKEFENIIDNLLLSGAWIHDRLQGRTARHGHSSYNGSMSKKVRKILGFTF